MKQLIIIARRMYLDKDGFLYGFVKGTTGSLFLISMLSVLTLIIE